MDTTIQISNALKKELLKRKFFAKETYEEVIWDLIEDSMELSEETKKTIERSRKDIKEGKIYSHKQVKEELGL